MVEAERLDISKGWRSPNFGERKAVLSGEVVVRYVVLHYTGMETKLAALERLCDPVSEVSAHYVVAENGAIHALVDEGKRAWHAGRSCWQGIPDMNSVSIGIEIVNKGHDFGYEDFPLAQMEAVKALCLDIKARYDLEADAFIGHSDIAPERKIDPGEKFPWEALAANGIGFWPQPQDMDLDAAQDLLGHDDALVDILGQIGYDVSVPFDTLISAFHRHYCPFKFDGDMGAAPDADTIARALALLRCVNEASALK